MKGPSIRAGVAGSFVVLVAAIWGTAAWRHDSVAGATGEPTWGTSERRELARVLGPVRPLQGRLAGFAYAPYSPQAAVKKSAQKTLSLLARRLERGVVWRGTAAGSSAGDFAALQLAAGGVDAESLRQASGLLGEALAAAPGEAPLLSDLAAVRLELADRADAPGERLQALAAALAAVEAEPDPPEARFNLALALEELSLPLAAPRAWRQYLDLTGEGRSSSPWAGEARQRLERVESPSEAERWGTRKTELLAAAEAGRRQEVEATVRTSPQPVRHLVEEELLGACGQSFEEGRPEEARETLAAAALLANAVAAAVHRDRALLFIALDDLAAAEHELGTAAGLVEAQRQTLGTDLLRTSYLDELRRLYRPPS